MTGSGAPVNLTQTVADGETIEQVADRLVADLVSTSAGDLSAEVVTVNPGVGSDGVRTTLQITSANGTTPQVELELRSDVETTESTVETSAFVSTLEIPTDAEIATLPANAELEVEIQGGDLDAAVTLTVSTGGFSSATALASQLQSCLLYTSPRPRD